MTFMEEYASVKELLKIYKRKKYWNLFTSADIFYLADEKHLGLFTFIDQFFGESYGCQLFFNKKGFNYVHDILTTNDEESVYFWDCDAICCALIDRDKLTAKDIEFLKKNKIRINKEDNLLVYRFEAGYNQRFANKTELRIFNDFLNYVESLVQNEGKTITDAFKDNKVPAAFFDNTNLTYTFFVKELPYLEEMPYNQKKNESFIEEFKDGVYVDDECYVYTSYLPVVIKQTNIRPMLVYFYLPNSNKNYIKYIIDKPSEYKNCIFGILYDLFTTIGIPTKMLFNNRDMYAATVKTLKELKVETIFNRKINESYSNVRDMISSVYNNSVDEVIEDKMFVQVFMQAITDLINQSLEDGEVVKDHVDFNSTDLVS